MALNLPCRRFIPTCLLLVLVACGFIMVSQACAPGAPLATEAPAPEEPAPVEPPETIIPTQTSSSLASPSPPSGVTPLPTVLPTQPPTIPEDRLLVLEWPPKIRVGDAEIVRLTLEMDTQGNLTPTAYVEGSQVRSEPVQIPNLYDTHDVIAQARLDLAGVEYRPNGEVSEALHPGQSVTFIWSVRPPEIGTFHGTVWMRLRFIPRTGGAEVSRVLTAQLIEIEALNFLGLGGTAARVLGSVGVVMGSVLSLDKLILWLWKLLVPREKRKA